MSTDQQKHLYNAVANAVSGGARIQRADDALAVTRIIYAMLVEFPESEHVLMILNSRVAAALGVTANLPPSPLSVDRT